MNKAIGATLVAGAVVISAGRAWNSYDRATVGRSQVNDLHQLAATYGNEDSPSLAGFKPDSQVGKDLKPCFEKMTALDVKFEKDLEACLVEAPFDLANLSTPAKVNRVRRSINQEEALYKKYSSDVKAVRKEIASVLQKNLHPSLGKDLEIANGEDAKLLRYRFELFSMYRELVAYVEKSKLKKQGNEFVFAQQSEEEEFSVLLAKVDTMERSFNRMAEKVLEEREAVRQESIQRLASQRI